MPGRYRRTRRKRTFRRRRTLRRRGIRRRGFRGRRRGKPIARKLHTFVFMQPYTIVQPAIGGGGEFRAVLTVQLNSCLGVSGFTTAFEYYRLVKWEVKIRPLTDKTVHIAPDVAPPQPIVLQADNTEITTVVDYNDAVIPSSVNVLKAYGSARTTRGTRVHTRWVKPAVLQPLSITHGTVTTTVPRFSPWCPCDTATVPHLGIKIGIQNESNYTIPRYRVEGRVWVTFKSRRPFVGDPAQDTQGEFTVGDIPADAADFDAGPQNVYERSFTEP